MLNNVIAINNVYLKNQKIIELKGKKLDITKVRILLSRLGFNPVAKGTQYIVEQLEYFYNNNLTGMKNLKQAYNISANIHNVDIKNIQWDIESAIVVMNRYADQELLQNIFYWYDNYKNMTPRFFMATMIDYLNENYNEYKK